MRTAALAILMITACGQARGLSIKSLVYPEMPTGYIKVIVQPGAESLTDVLFVMDDSGGMDPHQRTMASNVSILAADIAARGLSLHAAVVTTTGLNRTNPYLDNGRFRKILDSSSATFNKDLSQAMMVGIQGSSVGEHFNSVMMGLSEPLLSGVNAGFLRPSAHLAVMFVTDSEDHSKQTSQEFKEFLHDLKSQAGFSLHAFLPSRADASCPYQDIHKSGVKLETLINETGGQIFNLCAADRRASMLSIAEKLVNTVTRTIQLPTEPVISTIEVHFGGKNLAGGDLRGGWIYDETTKSVVIGDLFDFASQPAGTELEIKFVPKYWQ